LNECRPLNVAGHDFLGTPQIAGGDWAEIESALQGVGDRVRIEPAREEAA
jgi:hypothetical protein